MIEETDIFPSQDPLHVLIVDDDETDRHFAVGVLQNLGMETNIAQSISDATFQIQGLLAPKTPDIILLDMELGKEWGPHLCQRIRDRHDILHLPVCWIIGFTCHSTLDKIQEMLRAGANDFLSKPATPEALEAKMEVARFGHARTRAYKNRMRLLEGALSKDEKNH